MRKFLLLTMMCVLGIFAVNAQETITVGEKTNTDARIPFHTWYKYSYTQQIYTAEQIGHDAGTVVKIAFNNYLTNYTRSIKVYMQNTTKDCFESTEDWIAISASDLVFEGYVLTSSKIELVLTTPFEYTGGNMLLCVQDCTGSGPSSTSFDIMAESDGKNRTLLALSDNFQTGPDRLTGEQHSLAALKNVIGLTFSSGEITSIEAPVVKANPVSSSSIALSWASVLNATGYEVYADDVLLATVTETNYTVEGLETETQYCYTVKAINEEHELVSEASEAACAKTWVKLPDDFELVEIGADKNPSASASFHVPVYDYSKYSMSQQIYTAEDLAGHIGKNIYNVAFKLGDRSRDAVKRQYEVYITSTELSIFEGNNYVALSEADKVFDGEVEIEGLLDTWYTITLDNPYKYNGGNIVLTVYDKTGVGLGNAGYHFFYRYEATGRTLSSYNSNAIDMLALTTGTARAYVNQIRFGMGTPEGELEKSLVVNPKSLDLGIVALGNYWSEDTVTAKVEVKSLATTITSITCDNEFFTLSYDITTNPVVITVGHNGTAQAGEQTAAITVKADGVEDVIIPVTATAYTPVASDVYELAQEITFTDDAFESTPDFANLKDDYNLPKEVNKGQTPDAVYSFELEEENTVVVNVTGTNAVAAIYSEDFNGEGGPKERNNNKGILPVVKAEKTFFFDFQDKSLEAFTLKDDDNDGRTWEIGTKYGTENHYAMSYSYFSKALKPDNYMITKDLYSITASSKLSYTVEGVKDNPDNYSVIVSEDGEYFDVVYSETLPSDAATVRKIEVDLSAYAGKALYIGFRHHNCEGLYYVAIDDLRLTDGNVMTRGENAQPQIKVSYPAGKYYLVAAAEDQFTVSVTLEVAPPATPDTLKATTINETSIALEWGTVENIEGYNIYKGEELLKTVEANVTTYTVEDLEANTTYCFTVTAVNKGVESFKTEPACATTNDHVIAAPANVAVTAVDAFSVKLTWDAVEYAQSYNIYVGENTISTTETAYVFEGLNPSTEYCFEVTAVRNAQETEKVKACGNTEAIDFNDENLATEFFYDFNDQSLEDFMLLDADDDGNNWSVSEDKNNPGEYILKSYSDVIGNPDNYIYTKRPYRITETSVVTLNAKSGTGVADLGEHYAVIVSENGKDWTIVFEETIEHAKWTNTSVSLAAYAGKGVLVGIRHYNSSDLYFLAADNFRLSQLVLPAAPVVTAMATSSTTIALTWATVEEATSYNVYSADTLVANVTETKYVVENLTAESEYCFTVTSVNENGESKASEQVCVKTLKEGEEPSVPEPMVPSAPKVKAEATSDTTIVLTWNPVMTATSYNVYSDTVVIATVTETTYTVTGLKADTEYCFAVTAINENGESKASEQVCVKTATDGIDEFTSSFNIYPNPVNDKLVIETEEIVKEVVVYDIYGRRQELSAVSYQPSAVDVSGLNSGVYFVKVVTEKGETVQRFVKK